MCGIEILLQLLVTGSLLWVAGGDRLGLFSVDVDLVETGKDVATQTGEPEFGSSLTDCLVVLQGDKFSTVSLSVSQILWCTVSPAYPICSIIRQVSCITELSPDCQILNYWISLCLTLHQDGSRLCVLDWLSKSHQFPGKTKVGLQGGPWRNHIRRRTFSQQVPGVKSRPILDSTVYLVSTNCGRGEFEKVGNEWGVGLCVMSAT